MPGLPQWRRSAFAEFYRRVGEPPSPQAVALLGMRRVGKTVLLHQAIAELLATGGAAPANILYADFDYSLLVEAGLDEVVAAWREAVPREGDGLEYLFLDEVQCVPGWEKWVKRQVDQRVERRGDRRVAFTGSVMPLERAQQDTGAGRWRSLRVPTLSFSEYLHLAGVPPPELRPVAAPNELFGWKRIDFSAPVGVAAEYIGHFHRYLAQGGFPLTAGLANPRGARQALHDDILRPVLQGDIPAVSGVRSPADLRRVFRHLSAHEGGALNVQGLSKDMALARPTVQNYVEILEAGHLTYPLEPFGHGKEAARGRSKVYLSAPGMAAAMHPGWRLEDDLGIPVEAAVFRHLSAHCQSFGGGVSYWRRDEALEVDFVVEPDGGPDDERYLPIEVKYRTRGSQRLPAKRELAGLRAFCAQHGVGRAYLVTREPGDFGPVTLPPQEGGDMPIEVMRVPAVLLCYWLGQAESSWRMASV